MVAVEDQLEVRHLDSQKPKDAELRADILQALMLDNLVPASIDTEVEDGVVASTGSADWHYQRDAAKLTAARSTGRLDVVDEIGREAPIVISPGRIVQLVRLARKRREI